MQLAPICTVLQRSLRSERKRKNWPTPTLKQPYMEDVINAIKRLERQVDERLGALELEVRQTREAVEKNLMSQCVAASIKRSANMRHDKRVFTTPQRLVERSMSTFAPT